LRRYLPAFAVLSSVSVTPAVRRWSRFPAADSLLQSPFLSFFISPRNAPAIGLAGKSLVTGLPCAAQGAALLPAGSAHALNHDDAHRPVTKIDSSAGSETPLDGQPKVAAGLPIARVRDPGL